MKEKNTFLLKFTLVASAFMVQGDPMILQPNLGSLAASYPDLSFSTITMIVTLSAAFLGMSSLCTGKLSSILGKKRLLLIGSLLFSVGGVLTSFVPNFTLLLICRAVEGVGAGAAITVSMTLIPELFPDEKGSSQIIGMNGVATALCGILIGTAAGYLGIHSWQTANYLYLVGLLILVLQLLSVPSDKKLRGHAADGPKGKVTSSAYSVAVMAFLFAVISTMFMTSVANFIIEAGLGDSAQAGITISVMSVGSFLIGFAFAKIFDRFKSLTPALAYAFMAVGVFLPILVTTYMTTCIGAFAFGIGYGTYFPYINAEAIRISPPESADANISLINGSYYIGMFVSSFLMAAIAAIFHDASARFDYKFMGVVFVLFILYYVAAAKRQK